MSRPSSQRIAAAFVLLLAAACGDQPRTTTPPRDATTLGPPRRLTAADVQPACAASDYATAVAQVEALFASRVQSAAKRLLADIRAVCTTTTPAPDVPAERTRRLMNYVVAVEDYRARGFVVPSAANRVRSKALHAHLVTVFRYTGYLLPYLGRTLATGIYASDVFERQGFFGVCDASGCELMASDRTSGIKIYPNALPPRTGDDSRYVVSGFPANCEPFGAANAQDVLGQCVEISVDPKAGSSFQFAATGGPRALVQVCIADDDVLADQVEYLTDSVSLTIPGPPPSTIVTRRGKLAQLSGAQTFAKQRRMPRYGADVYGPNGFFMADCDKALTAPIDSYETSVGAASGNWFTRLAQAARRAFTVPVAYAGHGGLGTLPGFAEEISLFGPTDPYAFQATFEDDVIGSAPDTPDRNRGSWFPTQQSPGEITVQQGIANFGATNKVVVINQAGGAAGGRVGLSLLGNLFVYGGTSGATPLSSVGTYRVRWTSAITSPRAFKVNFDLYSASSTGVLADTLVRVRFANGVNAFSGPIQFGVPVDQNDLPLTTATWTRNVKQRFELVIDLDGDGSSSSTTGTATLRLWNGSAWTAIGTATFPRSGALYRVGWALTGIDAQIVASDDWEVLRLDESGDLVVP
ncbi:hypothetical protein [Roseisolibacter agri]|uniref:Uncharacterized protein n=1 Tax=Roseisolibacter agri TaxID=2014610 RepID=A0AA37QAJ9_9BACT|nr:hypothetical protein [Roseisolibacter agri]GLC26116.1 hypothetical protein rosag_26290 [Roseisolibacter agri]